MGDGARTLVQEVMEAEVHAHTGAGRYERADERTTYRNGYRLRPWDTRLQHVATAAAINVARLTDWLNGASIARTRTAPFAALAASP